MGSGLGLGVWVWVGVGFTVRARVRVRAHLGHGDIEVVQAARQQAALGTRLSEDGLDGLLIRRGGTW